MSLAIHQWHVNYRLVWAHGAQRLTAFL